MSLSVTQPSVRHVSAKTHPVVGDCGLDANVMKVVLPGSVDTVTSRRPYCDVVAFAVEPAKGKKAGDLVIVEVPRVTRYRPRVDRKHQQNPAGNNDNNSDNKQSDTVPRPRERRVRKVHHPVQSNTGNSGGGTGSTNAIATSKIGTTVLDANVYATKKTIAQGLLDVALLTANASQLKYLLQAGSEHEFYYVMMVLILLSIILQVSLGCVIILKGKRDINDEAQQARADLLNNIAVCLVFASTVVHVFLSVFTIKPTEQPPFLDLQRFKDNTSSPSPIDNENS